MLRNVIWIKQVLAAVRNVQAAIASRDFVNAKSAVMELAKLFDLDDETESVVDVYAALSSQNWHAFFKAMEKLFGQLALLIPPRTIQSGDSSEGSLRAEIDAFEAELANPLLLVQLLQLFGNAVIWFRNRK